MLFTGERLNFFFNHPEHNHGSVGPGRTPENLAI